MSDKKFTYNDLQPRVEMLIDALENKGSFASGTPYAPKVKEQASLYKELLTDIRQFKYGLELLKQTLKKYKSDTISYIENNQRYRIIQILEALDYYLIQEYHKIYDSKK